MLHTQQELPANAKKIGVKWVYRINLNELGEIEKYEERIVVRGYVEEHVIDYNELDAHVERMDTLRLIIAFAGQRRLMFLQPVHILVKIFG